MPPLSSDHSESRPWWRVLDPRDSLPALAALACGGASLALVVGLALTGSALLRQQIEKTLAPSFENLAYQVGDKLERALYERGRQLQFTAGLAQFRDPTTPREARQAALEALHDASPDYAWVGFAEAGGTIQAASQHLFEGEDAKQHAWFRSARRQTYIGQPRAFPELARAVPAIGADAPRFIDLAVPITARGGQFLGVLGAQVRWSWARDVQLSVISDSARRERLGVTLYSTTNEVLLDSGASGWSEPPDAPADLSTRPGARGNLTEHSALGTVYLTGYARTRGYRDYRGQGWLVVVRQPVADAFAPVTALRNRILQLGIGFSLLLGLVSWLVAARIERRLRAVAIAAERIGDGDVLTLMPMPSGDSDLARMCAALGRMVEKFRTRQETLETTNARHVQRNRPAEKP